MKIKNVDLKWNVLYYDFNSKKIRSYDVMNGIKDAVVKEIKAENIYNRTTLTLFLKKEFMYRYWSRTEYEILVSGLNTEFSTAEKIDIYKQLEMNIDQIVDYIIYKCDLKYNK